MTDAASIDSAGGGRGSNGNRADDDDDDVDDDVEGYYYGHIRDEVAAICRRLESLSSSSSIPAARSTDGGGGGNGEAVARTTTAAAAAEIISLNSLRLVDEAEALALLRALARVGAASSSGVRELSVDLDHCLSGEPGEIFLVPFLETVLPTHTSIVALDLSRNNLNDTHGALLANALKENTALKELRLSGNRIGTAGVTALAEEGLRYSKTLQHLSLRGNPVLSDGVKAIAAAISGRCDDDHDDDEEEEEEEGRCSSRCRLMRLDLSWCRVGDTGAKALADSLRSRASAEKRNRSSPSLIDLDIGFCGIGSAGFEALGDALRYNNTLTRLVLCGNYIRDPVSATYAAIESSLRHANYALEACRCFPDLLGNRLGHNIDVLCAENRRLKEVFRRLTNGNTDEGGAAPLPPCLWPQTLALIQSKPDLLYVLLKTRVVPELFAPSPAASSFLGGVEDVTGKRDSSAEL